MNIGNKRFSLKGIFIIAILVLLVLIGIVFIYQLNKSHQNEIESAVNIDTFYDGLYIDELPLVGLTMEQAKQRVQAKQQVLVDEIIVTVTTDTQSWIFTASDLSHSNDTDEILNLAYREGRSGTLEERYAIIKELTQNPKKLTTTFTVDAAPMESKVRDLATSLTLQPIDATLLEFNPTESPDKRFKFLSEAAGSQVDADELWTLVKSEIENKTYGTVQMKTTIIDPTIKIADLKKYTNLIASKTTKMVKDKNRQINIQLACAAINGKMLMPGEVFSFNDTTGQRTVAKGYKDAHVIINGKIDDGLAGGVCQVSGTLYNAEVMSDLETVERYKHSLASTYLPGGQDATVDYGHYDMKFKNTQSTPIYIIMYSDDTKLTVTAEIYGQPLSDGRSIKMVGETTNIIKPTGINYVADAAVPIGTTETFNAVTGKKITTYKVFYDKEGQELERKLLYTAIYKPQTQEIHYNPADPMFIIASPLPIPVLPLP